MNDIDQYSEASAPRPPAIRKPDFFIIGAPKAGTTSLYSYLAAHSRIFMPRTKEPLYFASDLELDNERKIRERAEYLSLFTGACLEHLACGEASPVYLMSQTAIPNILSFNPDALFIVLLRNPVDLVHSFHSQLVRDSWEPVADFEQAWRLQEARAEGQLIPGNCLESKYLQYRRVGALGAQVDRLLKRVPRDRAKFLMFDDLATNPKGVYEEVLAFLHVPSDRRDDFPVKNPNQTIRSVRLARLIRNPPFPLNLVKSQYRKYVGVGRWPARVLKELNLKRTSRSELPSCLRRELEAEFYEEVRQLELLIARDLSHWIPNRSRTPEALRQAA